LPRMAGKLRLAGDGFMLKLGALGTICLAVGAVLLLIYIGQPETHVAIEIGRAAITLGIGFILGGALKIMLDRYQDEVADKKKAHELRERLLADLRDVYDRAEAARLMHADTDGQHVRELIRCQVVLLKVKRSLDLQIAETHDVDPGRILLAEMIGYLRALQEESKGNDAHSPVLHDLTASAGIYKERFRDPLYKLSAQLLGNKDDHLHEADFERQVADVIRKIENPSAGASTHG
jgi:hypothetical protein